METLGGVTLSLASELNIGEDAAADFAGLGEDWMVTELETFLVMSLLSLEF